MKITIKAFGTEVSITLTEEELERVYECVRKKKIVEEVREDLEGIDDLAKQCKFPYPGISYFSEEAIQNLEKAILSDENFLYKMYQHQDPYHPLLAIARKELEQYGKSHFYLPNWFRPIEVTAYLKYQEDWIAKRNYSEEFWNLAKKEYQEYKEKFGKISFEEYINDCGFHGGECYACFSEFLDCEYQDPEYMASILAEKEYLEYAKER